MTTEDIDTGREGRGAAALDAAAPVEPAAEVDTQLIEDLTAQMHAAAEQLQFELAARYRDEIKGLKSELWHSQQAQK